MKFCGLDFGSAYGRLARLDDEGPVILRDPNQPENSAVLSSFISVSAGGQLQPGDKKSGLALWPVKKYFGQDSMDCGGKAVKPVEAAALILKEMRARTLQWSQTDFSEAVISVPSHFTSAQQEPLREAVQAAGFKILASVFETQAIGIAYSHLKKKRGIAAVCSFGAGFSEISIQDLGLAASAPLAAATIPFGGADIDARIAQNIAMEMENRQPELSSNEGLMRTVFAEAEKAKCALSVKGSYDFSFKAGEAEYAKAFSRYELTQWIQDLLEDIQPLCDKAVRESGIRPEEIDEVILAGGLSRMPLLREKIEKFFKKKPNSEIHPDQAAALGCAIHAGQLSLKNR
jgi:molecular chaperone DnaK